MQKGFIIEHRIFKYDKKLYTYGTAQIKLDSCTRVLVESLKKFCEILVSNTQAMYTYIMLHAV